MTEPAWLTQARSEGRITEGRPASADLDIDRIHQWAENPLPVKGAEKVRKGGEKGEDSPLRFELPLPPSVNGLFPGKAKRFKSPEYKAWIEAATLAVRAAKVRPWVASVSKPFGIEYTVVGPMNMSADLANREKALTDLLVSCGVIPGDSLRAGLWKVCLMYVHAADGMPHVKVEIHGV